MSRKKKQERAGIPEQMGKLAGSIRGRLPPIDKKRLLMQNIPYVIVLYLVDKAAWLYRHCIGASFVEKLGVLFLNFQLAFTDMLPSFHLYDLAAGVAGAAVVKLAVYLKGKNAKKYRQGVEYGSARWRTQSRLYLPTARTHGKQERKKIWRSLSIMRR
uniref:conjugal transfer protein TraG n=1 Tax=Enterocloster clostridioformis TaxID=1531 RepID=UPI0025A523FB|nr:conjugal transfer protein TraG [Enterocloster clostridioformis]